MKTCKNCYWYGQCLEANERCEYYDPIVGADNLIRREYEKILKERVEYYGNLVHEQQDDDCDV